MIDRLILLNDEYPKKEVVEDVCEKIAQGLLRDFPKNRQMHKIVDESIANLLDKRFQRKGLNSERK